MRRANVEDVVRSPFVRRLVSIAVAIGFGLSSLASLPAGSDQTCPAPDRSCAQAMFTDGCCQGQPPAAATTTTFAEAWSTLSRFHAELISWPVETAGIHLHGWSALTLTAPALQAPPRPPVLDLLSVLLI